MMKIKIGFVGAGNMAQALFSPLRKFFLENAAEIIIFTPTKTRAQKLASLIDTPGIVSVAEDIAEINACDVAILAHKPQQLSEVAFALKLNPRAKIISILASIEILELQKKFGVSEVLRLMPNTPAQVGEGVITYFHSEDKKNDFIPWINAFGEHSRMEKCLNEEMIDLLTPELGSGPGIVLELIRIFSESLEKKGLSSQRSSELAAAVFKGSGELVLKRNESPADLRDKVTSKGGITFECLKVMNENSIEKIFHETFKAGHNRAIELKN